MKRLCVTGTLAFHNLGSVEKSSKNEQGTVIFDDEPLMWLNEWKTSSGKNSNDGGTPSFKSLL